MNEFPDEEALAFHIDIADTEAEKQQVLTNAANSKAGLQGNITRINDTINLLIEKLGRIDNLPGQLTHTDFDTLDNGAVFRQF